MSKITIGVDNTADLNEETKKKHGFVSIYLGVVIGDKVHRCGDVAPEDVYEAVEKKNIVPKTNAALESDYEDFFKEATKDGGHVIHFSISDKLSASHANAKRAAEKFERVHVIDSKVLSGGTGILALMAQQMKEDGKSADEIAKEATALADKLDAGFIVNDLLYLYRGGRVSGMKLLGANLLKIRPSLEMQDGLLVPGKKFKGDFSKAVQEYAKHRIKQAGKINKEIVFIGHSDIDEKIISKFVEDIKAVGFKHVIREVIGSTVTTHCGRNTIGLGFFRE